MTLSRVLLRYGWSIGIRELERTTRISAETKLRVGVLAGIAFSPFVVGSYVWWLLTGRRLPGVVGRILPPRDMTTEVLVNPFPKNPPTGMREVLARARSLQRARL